MILTEYRAQSRSTQTEATTAATQLRAWVKSERGQHIWDTADTLPSLERICHTLDTTRAKVYGLLISPQFFTIISTYPHQAFTRLADRYQTAARRGICFWYDGSLLCHCAHCDTFFERLRMLPPPR
jgi:hypothetical protein